MAKMLVCTLLLRKNILKKQNNKRKTDQTISKRFRTITMALRLTNKLEYKKNCFNNNQCYSQTLFVRFFLESSWPVQASYPS